MNPSPVALSARSPNGGLDARLLERVKTALGLSGPIQNTVDGLSAVYGAWCRRVPFDNIRKMIDLSGGSGGRLGGLEAEDFFENWIENGIGGTCWPSSNALCVLLRSLGFEARRVAGSMFDLGVINHGTVKVRIAGRDWLADTSMITNVPLPVSEELYIGPKFGVTAEVEPVGRSHVIWADFVPMPVYVPCRLHSDPVDLDLYEERYEIFSRERSPFNNRLYFRIGGPQGSSVILGNYMFRRVGGEVVVKEFTREELCGHLRDAGVSGPMVKRWIAAGALDMSLDPANIPPVPEVVGVPPSLRLGDPTLN